MDIDPSQVAQALLEAFDALRSLSCGKNFSQEVIDSVSRTIQETSRHFFGLAAYIHIFRSVPDSTIRKYAAANIHLAFGANWVENSSKDDYLLQFFNILVNEPDSNVLENLVSAISRNITLDRLPSVIQFAKMALDSRSLPHIYSSLKLIEYTSLLFERHPDLSEFINNLTLAAMEFHDIDSTLAALAMVFAFYIKSNAEKNDGIDQIWIKAMELLPEMCTNPKTTENHLRQLCLIMEQPLSRGADFTEVEDFVPILLELLNSDFSSDMAKDITILIDAVASGYPEYMSQREEIFDIFDRYCLIASNYFVEDESLSLTLFDVFHSIVPSFSLNGGFLDNVWQMLAKYQESLPGIGSILLFFKYSFVNGYDFYEDLLDDVVNIILESLEIKSLSIRDCAIETLDSFITVFKTSLMDYAELFVNPLLSSMGEEPSIEVINILGTIFRTVLNTDSFFEDAFRILMGIFNSCTPDIQVCIIRCLASLAKNSLNSVVEYALDLFSIMQEIVQSEEGSDYYQMRGSALDIITALISRCPHLFHENATEIAQFIVQCMSDTSDMTLIVDAINTYGYLIRELPKSTEATLGAALEIVIEVSKMDCTKDIIELTKELVDTAMVTDQDIGINPEDDTSMIPQDNLIAPGAACSLYASIISTYPQLFSDHINIVVDRISMLSDSVIEYSIDFALRSCQFVFEAIHAAQQFDKEIIIRLARIIQEVIEKNSSIDIVGDAIVQQASMISNLGIACLGDHMNVITDILDSIVKCNLPCFDGEQSIPSVLFGPLKLIFREIFIAYGENLTDQIVSILEQNIIPLIFDSSSNSFFSMGIIAKWVENSPSTIDKEALAKILDRTIDVQIKHIDDSGFYLIKQIAKNIPEHILLLIEKVSQLFISRLSMKPKRSEAYLNMMDNLVSALGQIAIHVIPDSFFDVFPPEIIPRILSLMPARLDLGEDISIFEFYFWIAEKYQNVEQLASVLIRFFTMSKEDLHSSELSDEVIGTLKKCFISLVNNIPNSDDFISKECNNDETKFKYLLEQINS